MVANTRAIRPNPEKGTCSHSGEKASASSASRKCVTLAHARLQRLQATESAETALAPPAQHCAVARAVNAQVCVQMSTGRGSMRH